MLATLSLVIRHEALARRGRPYIRKGLKRAPGKVPPVYVTLLCYLLPRLK